MNSLAARFALPSTVDYNMVVNQSIPDEAQIPAALARVTVLNPRSSDELLDVVQNLDSTALRVGARLVILDSIAALARADFAHRGGGVVRGLDGGLELGGEGGGRAKGLVERQEMLGQVAAALKLTAETLRVTVLVTNQLTALRNNSSTKPLGPPIASLPATDSSRAHLKSMSYGTPMTAALGAKWAHGVNVRLVLQRRGDRRWACIAKSPYCPTAAVPYRIGKAGIEPDEDEADEARIEFKDGKKDGERSMGDAESKKRRWDVAQDVLAMEIFNEIEYGIDF